MEVDRQLKTNRKLLKTYNYQGFTTVQKAALLNFHPLLEEFKRGRVSICLRLWILRS